MWLPTANSVARGQVRRRASVPVPRADETSRAFQTLSMSMVDPTRPDLVDLGDVRLSQLGRYEAVAHAFDTYHAELYSFLRRAARDERAAEDLLQETFLRL